MTARSTARKTARGRRVRAWQKAEAVKLRPAISVTWFKAVLPWKTWMRNQWMMAAGVKRAEAHQVCPAARQAAWMTLLPSLAVRSCRSALRALGHLNAKTHSV